MHIWSWLIGSLLVLLVVVLAPLGVAAEENTLAQGKQLFTQQGCYGCHMIEKYGTPIATDLSHVGAKYDRAYLTRWLKDPSAQKPTAHMPKIALTDAEVQALATYLASLR
jgi:mono/diheme cytochrome c family protein